MPRVPVIADTHAGVRGNSEVVARHQERFFLDTFWPAVDAEGDVTDLIHLGDVTHDRRHILWSTIEHVKRVLFAPAAERGIRLHWVLGNHDLPAKNSTALSSHIAFREYTNIILYDMPVVRTVCGAQVLFAPWLNAQTTERFLKLVAGFKGPLVAGHFELLGFDMYRGNQNTYEGFSPDIMAHVPRVITGHYHHRSTKDNITYVGSPYDMNWADAEDVRGFHWWTPETNALQFVASPHRLFWKWVYDDAGRDESYVAALLQEMTSIAPGRVVKVYVRAKTNPQWYHTFVETVSRLGCEDLQVLEDPEAMIRAEMQDDEATPPPLAQDTLSIINDYTSSLEWANTSVQTAVTSLLTTLYHEAVEAASTVARA